MAGSFRHPRLPKLPVQRGLLRITGDTLQGPRESDWFDIVSAPGGDVGVVLLDLSTRHPSPAEVGSALLAKTARSFAESTPLHVMALDLARALFEYPGSELRATLVRCSTSSARVELTTAGMPPLACAQPGGHISIHGSSSPPLTSTTLMPPPVEAVPLVWGSTWLAVSDGFTAGSDHPDVVRRLALDLELPRRGLSLSGESADALYELLAARVAELGRFTRDDATLVLLGADPHARFESGIQRA